ncbi:hypothetical protein DFH27DRAFT_520116 [Peziza echinospora]|nr:hypothetical protein DFH27DRAFT_520116 [Peziza echinospora]
MAPTAVCTFFLQGRCRNGASCTFLHQNLQGSPKAVKVDQNWRQSGSKQKSQKETVLPVSTPRPSVRAPPPVDLFIPCKFFQAGYCMKGDSCTFQHVAPSSSIMPQKAEDEDRTRQLALPLVMPHKAGIDHSQTALRVMGATLSVVYGAGIEITSVTPASATSILTIHQLPENVEAQAVLDMLRPFDATLLPDAVRLTVLETSTYATVKLKDPAATEQAVASLDGLMYSGRSLSVKPYLPRGLSHLSPPVTRVSCTWYPPSKVATVSIYSSGARRVTAFVKGIKGKWVRGRQIDCIARGHTLSIGNLSPEVTRGDLTPLLKSMQVMGIDIHEPNYKSSADEVLAQAVSLFETNTRDIENCEILSLPDAPKTRAVVRFKTEAAAATAVRRYNGTKHSFLGDGPLYLQPLYTATFKIAADVHLATAQELAAIGSENKDSIRLKIFGGGQRAKKQLVTVRITGQKKTDVARIKALVGEILRGQLCTREGDSTPLWDPFFQSTTGIESVNDIARQTHTYIFCDKRKCQIFLFGTQDNREEASRKLHEALASSLEVGFHAINLDVGEWRDFIRNRVGPLRERFGSKIKINALKRSVEFKGSAKDLEVFRELLQSTISEGEDDLHVERNLGECPICFDTPDEPTEFSTESCSHMYCKACLIDYVKSTIDTRKFPIACVAMNAAQDGICGSGLGMPSASQILAPQELEGILAAAFIDYIRKHPTEYMYCPTANCNTVYKATADGKVLTCVDCLLEICTSCHIEAHDGETCAEYKAAHDPATVEREFTEWKARNGVKSCPRCKTDIQKASGCDHMTCVSCKAHICWKCMAVFDSSGPVYTHMNREHGSIGVEY